MVFDEQRSQLCSLDKICFFLCILVVGVRFKRQEGFNALIRLDWVATVLFIEVRVADASRLDALILLVGEYRSMDIEVNDVVVALSVLLCGHAQVIL